MATYIGLNSDGDNENNLTDQSHWLTAGYACPGSGKYNVLSLDVNIHNVGTNAYVRCGIFLTDGTFVMQWNAKQAVTGAGWMTGTSFVDQGGTPIASPQLDGGTTYLLVVTGDTGDGACSVHQVTNVNLGQYNGEDYTNGFPADILAASHGASTREVAIRCSVEAASGGSSVPGKVQYMRRRRQ